MTGSAFFMATQSVAAGIPIPAGHWLMDETTGTNVPDTSGNARHGTCYNGEATVGNGPVWTDDATRGWCLAFDGTNDFVGCPAFTGPDYFTITAWIYPTFTDTQKVIAAKRHTAQDSATTHANTQWNFQVGATNVLSMVIFSTNAAFQTVTGTTTIAPNTWTHVAGVYAGVNQTSTLYVNGSPAGTGTITVAMNQTAANPFQIGVRTASNNTRWWLGRIDDVRLYNDVLSSEQILSIYNTTVL